MAKAKTKPSEDLEDVVETTSNEKLSELLVPRYNVVNVPVKLDSGGYKFDSVAKADAGPVDFFSILEFWDELIKTDKSFDKEKAIDSIFTIKAESDPAE